MGRSHNKIHKYFKLLLLFIYSVHAVSEGLGLCTDTSYVNTPLRPFYALCRQLQGQVEYFTLFTVFWTICFCSPKT